MSSSLVAAALLASTAHARAAGYAPACINGVGDTAELVIALTKR